MTRFFLGVISLFLVISCVSDKYNLSPLTSSFAQSSDHSGVSTEKYSDFIIQNTSAADLTNLISAIPNFQNQALNKQIGLLKTNIQDYLYAIEAGNITGKERCQKKLENSYIQIQKIRKKLDPDEDDILNRLLVRIKTNVEQLKSSELIQYQKNHD